MIFHIGYIFLLLSFSLSLAALLFSIFFHQKEDKKLEKEIFLLRQSLIGVFYLNLFMVVLLGWLTISHTFSSVYVTENVNRALPFFYRFTAIWAGQAGSLVVWNFLSLFFAFLIFKKKYNHNLIFNQIMIRTFLMSSAFFSFILLFSDESNPFRFFVNSNNIITYPEDGSGMNPLLHHWAMIIHPPVLLLGYVSLIVPYALIQGVWFSEWKDKNVLNLIRKWMIFSVFTLGVGIILGALWSYDELGWGGYWSWDPVENASLIPFISGIVWLHRYSRISYTIQDLKGSTLWISLSYIGSILGVFITRSGWVTSVHAFGGTKLGIFFLIYLFLLLIILMIATFRWPAFSQIYRYRYLNLILSGMLIILLWGSLYPTLYKILLNDEISINENWFNRWMGGAGAFSFLLFIIYDYKKIKLHYILIMVIISFALVYGLMKFISIPKDSFGNFNFIFFMITLMILIYLLQKIIFQIIFKFRKINFSSEKISIMILHFSFLFLIAGFGAKLISYEESFSLKKGEVVRFANGLFVLDDFLQKKNVNTNIYLYESFALNISYYHRNHWVTSMKPEIRIYPQYNYLRGIYEKTQQTTEPAIYRRFFYDVYLQFAGIDDNGDFNIKILINYFSMWIWIGFIFFILSILYYWRSSNEK